MNNLHAHAKICDELIDIYRKKNADYGDSFHTSYEHFGLIAGVVRISDKFERLSNLAKGSEQNVKDESVRDTLMDMANYCIMSVMELDRAHGCDCDDCCPIDFGSSEDLL